MTDTPAPQAVLWVKPLHWKASSEGFGHGRMYYGSGVFGHWYGVSRAGKKAWACVHHIEGKPVHLPMQESLDAAKAAAQFDYESRVISAFLTPAPQPQEAQLDPFAKEAVEAIFADLRSRRTLKWLFDTADNGIVFSAGQDIRAIDLDVQAEIARTWREIISKAYGPGKPQVDRLQARVTDEMVEAACAAHWPGTWPGDRPQHIVDARRGDMRKALTAALEGENNA